MPIDKRVCVPTKSKCTSYATSHRLTIQYCRLYSVIYILRGRLVERWHGVLLSTQCAPCFSQRYQDTPRPNGRQERAEAQVLRQVRRLRRLLSGSVARHTWRHTKLLADNNDKRLFVNVTALFVDSWPSGRGADRRAPHRHDSRRSWDIQSANHHHTRSVITMRKNYTQWRVNTHPFNNYTYQVK